MHKHRCPFISRETCEISDNLNYRTRNPYIIHPMKIEHRFPSELDNHLIH